MSGRRNKSVSFGQEEQYLLQWAESQKGGFSPFVKRLLSEHHRSEEAAAELVLHPKVTELIDRLIASRLAEIPSPSNDKTVTQKGMTVTAEHLSGLF